MNVQPYDWIVRLEHLQRNCRLTLKIGATAIPLSFDDAIEFKIAIARILESGLPSPNDIRGATESWKANFFPNRGGFSVVVHHPAHSIATLVLNKRQTVVFSEELQDFIDRAGQCS